MRTSPLLCSALVFGFVYVSVCVAQDRFLLVSQRLLAAFAYCCFFVMLLLLALYFNISAFLRSLSRSKSVEQGIICSVHSLYHKPSPLSRFAAIAFVPSLFITIEGKLLFVFDVCVQVFPLSMLYNKPKLPTDPPATAFFPSPLITTLSTFRPEYPWFHVTPPSLLYHIPVLLLATIFKPLVLIEAELKIILGIIGVKVDGNQFWPPFIL